MSSNSSLAVSSLSSTRRRQPIKHPLSQGRAPIEAEPEDVSMRNTINTELSSTSNEEETKFKTYHVYKSAAEIEYHLDEAMDQGMSIVMVMDTLIKGLCLSAQRKEVWSAEIERYVFPPPEPIQLIPDVELIDFLAQPQNFHLFTLHHCNMWWCITRSDNHINHFANYLCSNRSCKVINRQRDIRRYGLLPYWH